MFSILENKRLVNDKIRLQNIRLIISNRVQMFSILENKRRTTKYDFKTSVSSFQIESKYFQYLKISVLSTAKYDFKTSVSSFQIESKCFQYLKISVERQNTTSKHPFHHFQM